MGKLRGQRDQLLHELEEANAQSKSLEEQLTRAKKIGAELQSEKEVELRSSRLTAPRSTPTPSDLSRSLNPAVQSREGAGGSQ